jgi:hypothetical protein
LRAGGLHVEQQDFESGRGKGAQAMKTMMLWHDGSQAPLAEKIGRAVSYYQRKYLAHPTVCLVHVSAFEPGCVVDGIKIEPSTQLLRNDLWLGEGEGA